MRALILSGLFCVAFTLPVSAKDKPKGEPVAENGAGTLPRDKGKVVLLVNAPHVDKKKFASMARDAEPIVDLPDDTELPKNYRASVDNLWHVPFKGTQPSIVGMADLQCSGSAEFSAGGWKALYLKLLSRDAQNITVVDLREESHGLVNNMAVSWYGFQDGINRGLTAEQVMNDESERLELLKDAGLISVGKFTDKSFGDMDAWRTIQLPVRVKMVRTEYNLVKELGCGYFRIAAPDYMRPPDAQVDRFVVFVRELDAGVWLHFHCCAGQGRTTTFMAMYDMMRNFKKVSAADILRRQYLLGGIDLTAVPTDKPEIKQQWAKERTVFLNQFYAYCQKYGPGYATSWSQYTKEKAAK